MKGWIKDYRQELDSDIWLMPPLYHRVWQWIKYKVNHEESHIPMRDGGKQKILKGQHMTSIRQIAQGVGWYEGRKWKEPNPKTIRSILKWLEQQEMITITALRGNNGYTLISVVNWEVYQSKNEEGNNEHPFEKQSTDINKNDKNEKKKENTRKRAKRIYDDDSPYMKMAIYFKDRVLSWKPNAKVPNDLNRWADDFRKLHELDKRTKQEIKDVIDWATSDSFWQANILSPGKLRKQFDTLQAQMSRKVIKMPEKPMSYWEEKQRREEELERKRLAERDKQMKVQRFIEVTGLHPMKHKDLLRDYLEGRVTLSELKKRRWGS